MRSFLPALATISLAACATAEPPAMGEESGFVCKGHSLPSFVGQTASQDLGARMLTATGAKTIRWVAKGMMVTMDFRADRLTVFLDGANHVESASCG